MFLTGWSRLRVRKVSFLHLSVCLSSLCFPVLYQLLLLSSPSLFPLSLFPLSLFVSHVAAAAVCWKRIIVRGLLIQSSHQVSVNLPLYSYTSKICRMTKLMTRSTKTLIMAHFYNHFSFQMHRTFEFPEKIEKKMQMYAFFPLTTILRLLGYVHRDNFGEEEDATRWHNK